MLLYTRLHKDNVKDVQNPLLKKYAQIYVDRENDFENTVATFGVPFETNNVSRDERTYMQSNTILVRNDDCSVCYGDISPACKACKTGLNSITFFISLQCTKHCYYCFNPNQDNYHYYLSHKRDINAELENLHARNIQLDYIAVTGGEPFLHKKELYQFLEAARLYYPHAHIRIYTCGDGLDNQEIERVATYIDEIRFSIKLEDSHDEIEHVLSLLKHVTKYIEYTMVEMPVFPNTLQRMKNLLCTLDKMDVFGINLLELCFPLHNADEFNKHNFKLRKPIYKATYNYWYGGGFPVAGSEKEALELVSYAADKNLQLHVHYCSADNKNTGQIYQQNFPVKNKYPTHMFSKRDFFLKSIKVFGENAKHIKHIFETQNVDPKLYLENSQHDFIEYNPRINNMLIGKVKDSEALISYCVHEQMPQEKRLAEIKVDLTSINSFEIKKDI